MTNKKIYEWYNQAIHLLNLTFTCIVKIYSFIIQMGANTGCCYAQSDQLSFNQYCLANASTPFQPYLTQIFQQNSPMNDAVMGEWQNKQQKTGKGIIYSYERFYYQGDIVGSKANGDGQIIWPNKIIYRGKVADNKANGQGILIFDGEEMSIKGLWHNGEPALNQKLSLIKNQQKFQITIHQIHRQKEGDKLIARVQFQGGLIYEGEVRSRSNHEYKIQGKGKLTFTDGSNYSGQFYQGKMHGKGVYHWSKTEHWYEGQYKNNLRDGLGTYFYSKQNYKQGTWKGGHFQNHTQLHESD